MLLSGHTLVCVCVVMGWERSASQALHNDIRSMLVAQAVIRCGVGCEYTKVCVKY